MEDQHIVTAFDRDLAELNRMIAQLGGMAEQQLATATCLLDARDPAPIDALIAKDKELDALEFLLNERAIEMIAIRSPMATDLRRIIAAVKIASVLERIGDYAKNIAKRSRVIIASETNRSDSISLTRMASLVQQMLNQVLDAYATSDAESAMDVWDRDQEVDQLHTSMYRDLLQMISAQSEVAEVSSHLLFIAKNIERIGDHTTSIAEQVYFLVHGSLPSDDRPKADDSSGTNLGSQKKR
ncbi:MAG: phosphate signaling complex protein PhoU [Alphaproteobacteria bacterium]|nr:phosphate signaling complex protein PhoU [Alphaproteobacteria bacterium]